MKLRVFILFALGLKLISAKLIGESSHEISPQPPEPFWDYLSMTEDGPKTDTIFPASNFWQLYNNLDDKQSTNYGGYERDVPKTWKDTPDSSNIHSVTYMVTNPEKHKNKSSKRLYLGSRPRMSHGPRKKRSATKKDIEKLIDFKKKLMNIPLYCWKVLINCKRYRAHVCCPIMPDFLRFEEDIEKDKLASERRKRSIKYYDPLFGIPISRPSLSHQIQRRQWKPYCPVNCSINPTAPCCERDEDQIDRIYFEPFVQPTLIENWMSGLFEIFGNNPVAWIGAKIVLIISSFFAIGGLLVLWTRLGQKVGMVPEQWPSFRSGGGKDLLDLTSKVVLAVEDANWLEKLTEKVKQTDAFGKANRFICCMVNSGTDEVVKERVARSLKSLECYKTEVKGSLNVKTALDCVSNLVYDVSINQERALAANEHE